MRSHPKSTAFAAVGVVAILIFAIGVYGIARQSKNWPDYRPQNNAEVQLFSNLTPATKDQAQALRLAGEHIWQIDPRDLLYIATHDFTLPPTPLGDVIVIGVPHGIKWQAGPRTNVVLVFAHFAIKDLELGLREGYVVHDPICTSPSTTEAQLAPDWHPQCAPGDPFMHDRTAARSSDVQEAIQLTQSDIPQHLAKNIFVTTGDVKLWPGEYLLIVQKGHNIIGGQLGRAIAVYVDGEEKLRIQDPLYYPPATALTDVSTIVAYQKPSLCPYLSRKVLSNFAGVCVN